MEPSRPEDSSLAPTTSTTPAVADADADADLRARRWHLVRDLAVFQLKLFIDGLKDLVLSPIAVVVVLIGLVSKREDPGQTFYSILRLGHGFDRWLNLFGTPEPPALPSETGSPSATPPPAPSSQGVDSYVHRVEQALAEQVRRGGLTAKAKDAIDNALDSLHDRRGPPSQ